MSFTATGCDGGAGYGSYPVAGFGIIDVEPYDFFRCSNVTKIKYEFSLTVW
jgi:hypothetical protein